MSSTNAARGPAMQEEARTYAREWSDDSCAPRRVALYEQVIGTVRALPS